jgi:glycine cleavage system H protein
VEVAEGASQVIPGESLRQKDRADRCLLESERLTVTVRRTEGANQAFSLVKLSGIRQRTLAHYCAMRPFLLLGEIKETIMSTKILPDLHYTKEDEWIRVENGEAAVGITDHAQDSLSDIVFLEFPGEGDSFDMGDSFGVVESVKAAADLTMPVGGEVTAVNEDLLDEPEALNNDPYGSWLIKIQIYDSSELEQLMDATAYAAYCEERE